MALAAAILLGFALRPRRLAHLGDLEFDEIVSVRYGALPPIRLLPKLVRAPLEHPPAFYPVLTWRRAFADRLGGALHQRYLNILNV